MESNNLLRIEKRIMKNLKKKKKNGEFISNFYQLKVFSGEPIWFNLRHLKAKICLELRFPSDKNEFEQYFEKATHFKY